MNSDAAVTLPTEGNAELKNLNNRTKILDCTLRDGGYYTQWDFDSNIVESYIHAMNNLPIDYIEVGYRNNIDKDYLGKFGYSPVSILQRIRKNCTKKLVVMLNEKSTTPANLPALLGPIRGVVDMIRIAIDPKNFDRAVILAKEVKKLGFEVGFNCMYMSKWDSEYSGFLSKLSVLNDFCDLFCMVDSFGGIAPEELKSIFREVKTNTSVPVGFHGHNNLQLGLINTVTAISLGIDYVDVTVLGMGRGAGNCNTELLLTYLNSKVDLNVNFNILGEVISAFYPLLEKYHWGTNLPYMIAGANGIPQKEVMEWVTNRAYSFNSVVRALDNRKQHKRDNAKFPKFTFQHRFDRVIIIGGGESVKTHIDGIREFLKNGKRTGLIFATARHASLFKDSDISKFYVLVGSESKRLSANINPEKFSGTIILPPYPREMGTDVPEYARENTYELDSIDFIDEYKDSCTTIAMQIALNISHGDILSIGYDGYSGNVLSEKEMALTHENIKIFNAYYHYRGEKLKSLTPSLYNGLSVDSLYHYL